VRKEFIKVVKYVRFSLKGQFLFGFFFILSVVDIAINFLICKEFTYVLETLNYNSFSSLFVIAVKFKLNLQLPVQLLKFLEVGIHVTTIV
jgi:hypothetical protein